MNNNLKNNMTKQEIDNLKVGDWFCDDELHYFEIIAIFTTDYGYRNYICKSKDFIYEVCITEDKVEKMTPFKKQPKKITLYSKTFFCLSHYTLETFPENALWVRNKKWLKKEKAIITSVNKEGIGFDECYFSFSDDYVLENYEIGCQIIKDGKIEIEWKPFYQIK